ncbi:MAG: RES family NAD+ phosphorylase [Spirochaetia bacterium]|nr:RES family NAD+ phosphorylase [Spirochaetia bacterium]
MRAIIRFEYSEFEYDDRAGLERLLQGENFILPTLPSLSIQNIYQKRKIFGRWTPQPLMEICALERKHNDIPIFASEENLGGAFDLPLKDFSADWRRLRIHFDQGERDSFEKILTHNLSEHLPGIRCKLKKGRTFFRARIGCNESIQNKATVRTPYQGSAIDRSPAGISKAGKFNPKEVSVFYAADNLKTAVAETRPHPGHYVSVGKFSLKDDIQLIDLSIIPFYKFCNNTRDLATFAFLKALQAFVVTPIVPEEQHLYDLTISIAQLCRSLGFLGIRYPSSVGSGLNVALFDDHVDYIGGSSKLYRLRELKFELKEVVYKLNRKQIPCET